MTSRATAVVIRNKRYGSTFRLIRTAAQGGDLYWVMRGINPDGTEHKGVSYLSVDSWGTGDWEVVV